MSKPIISLRGVTKQYVLGSIVVDALSGIDLDIYEGQFVAIVGSSGCGKSTLMNIIGLLDRQTEGEYEIDGINTRDANDDVFSRLRNQKIGFVFQSYNLLPKLNVLDNVAVPLLYRGWSDRQIVPRCREMLALVDMDTREHHLPNELSGGQQQRVAIARALAGKPSLILADEPTGALDHKTSKDIMDLFYSLNEKQGITVIIITHDPEIAANAPRTVTLYDGLVVKDTMEAVRS